MKRMPHLTAAIISLVVLTMALIGFNSYAQSLEQQYVNALAPLDLPQALNGSALQRAALSKPDLLPVYGSSEMLVNGGPYETEKFFATYPTGFTIINISSEGASSLTVAQNLAALGPDLKGKKVVISFTPMLFTSIVLSRYYYAGNYLSLHAYGLIFSPYLSMQLKSAAAQRMLDYPNTLQGDPILRFALKHLADSSIHSRFLYVIIWPLGELQTEVMRLQDHAEVVLYILGHRINPNVQRVPQRIDWANDLLSARAEQKLQTLSNPYGIEDTVWNHAQIRSMVLPLDPGSGDAGFLQFLKNSKEWPDFKILLGVLRELGAEPLILSRPINVHIWQAQGVSEQAQNIYYIKLNDIVNQYHMPLVDYQQYGTDIYFSIDPGSHSSPEGWVYVDQTLDDFFHGRIEP